MAPSSADLSLSFATLTPDSKVAQAQLASLVAKRRQDTVVSPMDLVLANRHSNNPTSSDAHDLNSRSKYEIIFTFSRQGHGRLSAWVVGKLSSDKDEQQIDLPICSSRSRSIKGLQLFEVFIHPTSGVLTICNLNKNHSLWYLNADNQGDHVELRYQETYVLHMSNNLLRIGSLQYTFRYSINVISAYLANRKDYMQKRLRNWDIPSCFAIQPQHDHIRLRHVILHNVIAKGDTCVVRVGVNRKTGDPMACKTIQCSQDNIDAVLNEINIARLIATHAFNGLVPLLYTSCGHGFEFPCSQRVEDMHLVMPYAPFTFETAPWQEIRPSDKLALFRNAFEGLKNLHAVGIMHRDINPSNLLVFSLQPAAAAISDFGMAKMGFQSAEKSLGPLAYQAPEVAAQETYTNSIDIFSLALSILATFEGCMWSGPLSDREHHSTVLNHLASLETRMPDGLATLLSAMLSWDPSHRPSAEDVLADAVWKQITDPDSDGTSDRHGSERSSSFQWSGDGDLPLPGLDGEDGPDRILQRPIPNTSPGSLSLDSNTSGADDMSQRMNRSDAPPPSSIANDDDSSTAEVPGWDSISERMNRSDAPPPSSIANDNDSSTAEVPGWDNMSERMNRSDAPPPSSIADGDAISTTEVPGWDNISDRMNRSEAPSPLSTANDTGSA